MAMALYSKYRQHWVYFEPIELDANGKIQAINPNTLSQTFSHQLQQALLADGVHFRINKTGEVYIHQYKATDERWRLDYSHRAVMLPSQPQR